MVSIPISEKGTPYVAYHDEGGSMRRTTVMKFGNTTEVSTMTEGAQFSDYPNPGKGLFTIETPEAENKSFDMRVINQIGRTVHL